MTLFFTDMQSRHFPHATFEEIRATTDWFTTAKDRDVIRLVHSGGVIYAQRQHITRIEVDKA